MVILESRYKPGQSVSPNHDFIEGYFLTINDLARLVRDFQADCHDGFVSNDIGYLEEWLKKHKTIEVD